MTTETHDTIYDKVSRTIAEIAGINLSSMTLETHLFSDLDLDSLAMYEMVIDLEEHFDLQISDSDLDHIQTVGDAVNYIERHLNT